LGESNKLHFKPARKNIYTQSDEREIEYFMLLHHDRFRRLYKALTIVNNCEKSDRSAMKYFDSFQV